MYILLIIFFALVISSIIINGIYSITRGRWEVKPNGEKYWTGKIFNFWHKMLQTHTTKKVFYSGDEFLKIFDSVSVFITGDLFEIEIDYLVVMNMSEVDIKKLTAKCASRNIGITFKKVDSGQIIHFYKEEKIYKLPYGLRDPLGECITCMASFWGTICWFAWGGLFTVLNDRFQIPHFDQLLSLPTAYKFILWAIFCLSLAYLNEVLAQVNAWLKK